MFKENKDGQTHFYGDGCKPPHRCPAGTCQRAYNGVCKVCNEMVESNPQEIKSRISKKVSRKKTFRKSPQAPRVSSLK